MTDVTVPKRFDDVRQYVIKRPLPKKEGKKQRFRSPKIQRLVTPVVLQVSLFIMLFSNPLSHYRPKLNFVSSKIGW